MSGIGIISNPYARINKRNPEHNTLMWYVLGNHGQFEVTRSLEDLSRVCSEFAARSLDHVGILGGDGTVSLTLSAIEKAYLSEGKPLPKIMLLRGGTVNVLANNLGIGGSPESLLQKYSLQFHSNQPFTYKRLTSLKIEGRTGFLFANGAACRFLEEFYRNKSNALGAGVFFSKVFLGATMGGPYRKLFERITKPEPMVVETFPEPLWPHLVTRAPREYSMVFVTTLPRMPFGLKLAQSLQAGARHSEVIAISTQGKELAREAMRIMKGGALRSDGNVQKLCEKVIFHVPPGSLYSLDGDILKCGRGKLEVEIGSTFDFATLL